MKHFGPILLAVAFGFFVGRVSLAKRPAATDHFQIGQQVTVLRPVDSQLLPGDVRIQRHERILTRVTRIYDGERSVAHGEAKAGPTWRIETAGKAYSLTPDRE